MNVRLEESIFIEQGQTPNGFSVDMMSASLVTYEKSLADGIHTIQYPRNADSIQWESLQIGAADGIVPRFFPPRGRTTSVAAQFVSVYSRRRPRSSGRRLEQPPGNFALQQFVERRFFNPLPLPAR